MPDALQVTLEFNPKQETGDPFAVRTCTQVYAGRGAAGSYEDCTLHWDTPLQEALDAFRRPRPPASLAQWIGDRLRDFVGPLEWGMREQAIQEALRQGRRVSLNLVSAAAEL